MGLDIRILRQYLHDTGKFRNTGINLQGTVTGIMLENENADVSDLKQIISNVPKFDPNDPNEELKSLIIDEEKNSIKDPFIVPNLSLKGMKPFNAMHLAYSLLIREKYSPDEKPVNISDIAFMVKNALALPDEMFIDFPIHAMEKEYHSGDLYLSQNGIVDGIRLYHVIYGLSGMRAIPCLAIPASYGLETPISYEKLMEKLTSCFVEIKNRPSYNKYIKYRKFKNIVKKFQSKNWNRAKLKMFTEDEILLAKETDLFVSDDEFLSPGTEKTEKESLNLLSIMSRDAEIFVKEWKDMDVFP